MSTSIVTGVDDLPCYIAFYFYDPYSCKFLTFLSKYTCFFIVMTG